MSITDWTILAIAIALPTVSLAYAFHTLDGGRLVSNPKIVIAAKSDRLPSAAQAAALYMTVESPLPDGSTLSLVAVKEAGDDISRAN
jgi:hypothetical protein